MARPKDLGLEHTWRLRLRRQATSSLSIPDFCRREGVSTASFYAWKRRLIAPPVTTPSDPPLFVPIRLDPSIRPDGSSPPWPIPPRGRTPDDLAPLRRPRVLLHPIGRHEEGLRRPLGPGRGVLPPGPPRRPSLPLRQPPQGSHQGTLLRS